MEDDSPVTTECSRETYLFPGLGRREGVARFDGGAISSDGGMLLLHEVERGTGVLERFSRCFTDHRNPLQVAFGVEDLVRQRVFGLCLGYEDLNDHEALRHDPLLAAVVGRDGLAGKSTLNRLELSRPEDAAGHRYKRVFLDAEAADAALVDVFLDAHTEPPGHIVLDLDTTDFPLHGHQEGRFFHGYYDHYCYLPLYIFCGEHLLLARLRTADRDAAHGAREEVEAVVARIRARWPKTRIVLRADSGFCREELMAWCEREGHDFALGMARNARLQEAIEEEMAQARALCQTTGKAARVFTEFGYSTLHSWSRHRRVVAKAECLPLGSNPRFVVTSFLPGEVDARGLYEDLYCARGDMENRIKEQQLDLFASRVSAATMRANQVRLYFASFAYVLLCALRRLGVQDHEELATAQCGTLRLKLLKVGARIRVTTRKVWVSLSSAWPYAALFAAVYANLREVVPRPG
jgi:hypothetical protein